MTNASVISATSGPACSAQRAGSLSTLRDDQGMDVFPIAPTGHIVGTGLVLHFENTLANRNHVSLHLAYSVNHGLDEDNETHSIFRLER